MREIRLNRAASVPDFERDTEYLGPGTFEVEDDAADEYLQKEIWEPADAFDADDFLDADEQELVDRMTYPSGAVYHQWDDKLADLFDAEAQGEQRIRILNLLREREQKAKAERGQAGSAYLDPAETREIGKLAVLGSRRPEQVLTEEDFRDGEAPEWARESEQSDENTQNNPYEEEN